MALNPFGKKTPASATGTEAQTIIETSAPEQATASKRPPAPARPGGRLGMLGGIFVACAAISAECSGCLSLVCSGDTLLLHWH